MALSPPKWAWGFPGLGLSCCSSLPSEHSDCLYHSLANQDFKIISCRARPHWSVAVALANPNSLTPTVVIDGQADATHSIRLEHEQHGQIPGRQVKFSVVQKKIQNEKDNARRCAFQSTAVKKTHKVERKKNTVANPFDVPTPHRKAEGQQCVSCVSTGVQSEACPQTTDNMKKGCIKVC